MLQLRYILVMLTILLAAESQAQRNMLTIGGAVFEKEQKLSGVTINVMKQDEKLDSHLTKDNGKFKFDLDLEANYVILFSKHGYISKKVTIKAMDIPEDAARFGFENLGWELAMIPVPQNMDLSLFDKPIAQMKYDSATAVFQWDIEFIGNIQPELDAFNERLEFVQDSIANADVVAAQNKEQFEILFKQAFNAHQNNDLGKALDLYTEMLKLQPDNQEVASTVKEIKTEQARRAEEAKIKQEKLAEQQTIIDQAQMLANKGDYKMALAELEQARRFGLRDDEVAKLIYEYRQKLQNWEKALSEYETNLNALEVQVNALDEKGPYYGSFMKDYTGARDKLNYTIKTAGELGLTSEMLNFHKNVLDELKAMYDQWLVDLAAKNKAKADSIAAANKAREDSIATAQAKLDDYIRKAKTNEASGDKQTALLFYKNALALDPGNRQLQFKVEQLSKADQPVADQPKTETKDFEVKQFKDASELQEYQNELAKKYPSGMTEEVIKLDNKTIYRRIVVVDGKGSEYFKILHNWGGKFYFKNGLSITNLTWDKETDL